MCEEDEYIQREIIRRSMIPNVFLILAVPKGVDHFFLIRISRRKLVAKKIFGYYLGRKVLVGVLTEGSRRKQFLWITYCCEEAPVPNRALS